MPFINLYAVSSVTVTWRTDNPSSSGPSLALGRIADRELLAVLPKKRATYNREIASTIVRSRPRHLGAVGANARTAARRRYTPSIEYVPISAPTSSSALRSAEMVDALTIVAVRFVEPLEKLGWLSALAERPGIQVVVVNKGKALQLPNVTIVDMENVCREGFGYLWALDFLPPPQLPQASTAATVVFTQARLKLADSGAFERWIAAVRAARPPDASCFSFFGGIVPGTVNKNAVGSGMPYMFGATNGPAGGAFRSRHYRSKLLCADEDWSQWTTATRFGPGGTFAVSRSLVQALPSTLRRAALDELRTSYSNRSRQCLMEYVYERSWGRLWTRCNTSVPRCETASPS